jgi:eukaryotic-like serine/threonine-protein kinase
MDQEHGGAESATLGRYRLTGELGTGLMGRVLLGVDEAGRQAAIRVVHPQLAAEPGFRDRFRREVQVAATAPAWFVAPVLDADPDADPPWLATAFVEGPPLHRFVAEHGPLGRQGTVALAVRMAEGLAALHGTGLVHRDLKPSNVVLAADGPRLVDFGIARAGDGSPLSGGPVMGTPAFLSPELVAGARDVGPASDIFSFGSLIGFAATGRSPFADASPAAEAHRVASGPVDLGPVAADLREILLACLARDPAARPTAAQVRDRLRTLDEPEAATAAMPAAPTVVAPAPPPPPAGPPHEQPTMIGRPVLTPPPADPRRRRGVVMAVAAAAVAAAAIAVLAVVLLNRDGGGPAPTAAPAPAGAPPASATGPQISGETVREFDVATDDRFGSGSARFVTPSGNIACFLGPGEARCDVRERSWQIPAQPADCELAYGTGALLRAGQEGQLSCVGDTVADPSLEVLEYGQAVRLGDIVCTSRETGVRCADERSRHGFAVARASYDLF